MRSSNLTACLQEWSSFLPRMRVSGLSIQKVIDDCDYYVLIIAGRYGSCDSEGISYTEKEYRYAISANKPTIAFLHKDPGNIAAKRCESAKEGKEKLAAFRALVETKLCKYWSNPSELGSVVSRSLVQLMKSTPAIGWVRANELPDKDAAIELLRLREQVEELEGQLARIRITAPKGAEELAQGEDILQVTYGFDVREGFQRLAKYHFSLTISWNSLFGVCGPPHDERDIRRGFPGINQQLPPQSGILQNHQER